MKNVNKKYMCWATVLFYDNCTKHYFFSELCYDRLQSDAVPNQVCCTLCTVYSESYTVEHNSKANPSDGCAFTKNTKHGQVRVRLYVDDIFATTKSEQDLDQLIQEHVNEYKSLTITRKRRREYLGMLFEFGDKETVLVKMKKYIGYALQECGTTTSADTPAGT